MRQNGALFAKGFLLGMQFEPLLKDGLYEKLGRHANEMAMVLAEGLTKKGYTFHYKPVSNQIFPIVDHTFAEKLAKDIAFETTFHNNDGTDTIRFVTSWATTKEEVDAALALM